MDALLKFSRLIDVLNEKMGLVANWLVLIACVVAIPLSFYFMNQWLMQYQYRMDISWSIFVIASGGALVVTLLTVSFQSIKAALSNPVRSLRSE